MDKDKLGWDDVGDCALFDRMAKVGQDPHVELFQLTWGRDEATGGEDAFAALLKGDVVVPLAVVGPRYKWKSLLTWILDEWDQIKEPIDTKDGEE